MTINNKTLSTLQGLVTSTSTNEGDFRTGMNDVLAQVNANQEALAIAVSNPQVITTLTSGSSYVVPSDALAIYIRASGGGGGGNIFYYNEPPEGQTQYSSGRGGTGGDTTISNVALSLSITAKGGTGGSVANRQHATGDSGGTVQRGQGAAGGNSRNTISSNTFQASLASSKAPSGNLVSTYINSPSVAGKTLSYSIGAGGVGAYYSYYNQYAESGQPGYIEIWVW